MKRNPRTPESARARWRLLPVLGLGLLAEAASGQGMEMNLDSGPKAVEVRAPAPADPGSPPFFLVYLVGLGLSAAAVGLAIMPSKRTHQD